MQLHSNKAGWRGSLDVMAAASMIVASAVFVWAVVSIRLQIQSEPQLKRPADRRLERVSARATLPVDPIAFGVGEISGQSGAKVAVLVYSDFQCPFCSSFAAETLPAIKTQYVDSGRIKIGFRHLPLEAKHPLALRAAEASECGGRQGKFWEMHDALFSPLLRAADTEKSLYARAAGINLDPARFRRCMQGEVMSTVREHIAEASLLRITGTPTFLFGTIEQDGRLKVRRRESGALPFSVFAEILNDLLNPARQS
jgi:protein-disulfide isomerase